MGGVGGENSGENHGGDDAEVPHSSSHRNRRRRELRGGSERGGHWPRHGRSVHVALAGDFDLGSAKRLDISARGGGGHSRRRRVQPALRALHAIGSAAGARRFALESSWDAVAGPPCSFAEIRIPCCSSTKWPNRIRLS